METSVLKALRIVAAVEDIDLGVNFTLKKLNTGDTDRILDILKGYSFVILSDDLDYNVISQLKFTETSIYEVEYPDLTITLYFYKGSLVIIDWEWW